MLAVLACLLLAGAATRAASTEPSAVEDGVRMGYSTRLLFDVSRADAEAAVSIWARELGRATGFAGPTTATIYDDLNGLLAQVRAGALDVVALNSLDYLRIRAEEFVEPALVGLRGGKAADRQLLLVHRDSGIDTLGNLRGKSLAILKSGEDLATLWLDTLLARDGLPGTTQFLGVARDGTRASKALLPVFFRRMDACVVNGNAYATAVELNPQLGRDLVVLARSPEFPLGLVCLRADLDARRKARILESSLRVVTTPAGRQVLTLFKVDDVARFEPGLLDSLERILREHDGLTGVARAEP
jgi:phosphonate transport system substrate-binding protein